LILFLFGPALILPGLSISPRRDFQLPSPAWFPVAASRRSFSSARFLLLRARGFSSPAGLLRPGALHSAGPHATGSPPPALGTSVSSSAERVARSFFLSCSFFYQFRQPLFVFARHGWPVPISFFRPRSSPPAEFLWPLRFSVLCCSLWSTPVRRHSSLSF
jgi:hypothetical protein